MSQLRYYSIAFLFVCFDQERICSKAKKISVICFNEECE